MNKPLHLLKTVRFSVTYLYVGGEMQKGINNNLAGQIEEYLVYAELGKR